MTRISFFTRSSFPTLDATERALAQAAEAFAGNIDRLVLPYAQGRANETLNKEPGKPTYPLNWASPAQKKAVMTKLRREKNLPYRRTGKSRTWKAIREAQGPRQFVLLYRNEVPWAQFLFGNRQQPFHRDTGWPYAAETVIKEREMIVDKVRQAWREVILPRGLGRG